MWQSATALILIVGIVSSGFSSQAKTWWGWSEHDVEFAEIIDKTENPLVISNLPLYATIPFTHQLNPDTKMLLIKNTESLKIPQNFQNIFFYNPTQPFLSTLKKNNISIKEVSAITDPLTLNSFRLYKYVNNRDN